MISSGISAVRAAKPLYFSLSSSYNPLFNARHYSNAVKRSRFGSGRKQEVQQPQVSETLSQKFIPIKSSKSSVTSDTKARAPGISKRKKESTQTTGLNRSIPPKASKEPHIIAEEPPIEKLTQQSPPQKEAKQKNEVTPTPDKRNTADTNTKQVRVKSKPKPVSNAKPATTMIKQESKPKIDIPSFITVANFSTILRVRVPSLLQNLAELGFENMTNDYILDFETAHLIADEYGFEVNQDDDLGLDLFPSSDNKNALPRAPIVTIMGHVDHGKTTILDYLRKSSIVKGEHGGITQHIGAFSVKTPISKKNITFLDTPGHAAFLKMRERGANITDVVVLVVAAEDSVMPQTIEAIKHSKKAGVPVVVAINKCDKEEANPDKVVADLSAHGIDVEDYGGEIPTVKISAKTGMGMDDLEETIVTVSDMLELKSPITKVPVEGYILESEIKKGLGKVATFLVKRGQLKPGTILVSGTTWAKVKVMRDEHGKPLKVAGPATPVEVSGWKEIPDAGEYTIQADSEAIAKKVIRNREKRYRLLEEASHIQEINKRRIEQAEKAERDQKIQSHQQLGFTLEEIREMEPELFEHEKSQVTTVPFIIKADVSGSAEAVAQSIEGLGNHEVNSRVLFHAVGTPTESDIERAKMAGATILAFNLKVPQELKNTAALAGVEIKEFNVIYHLIENVLEVLTEKLPRRVETKVVSKVQVRQIFEISKGKKTFRIAGSKVIEGVFKKNATVRLTRETNSDYVPYTGRISQLKIEKDDVTEVKNGVECGIELAGDPDLLPGDILEAIEEVEVKRHL